MAKEAHITVKLADLEPVKAALYALAELHKPDEQQEFCAHDGFIWPCSTVRILMRLVGVES